MSDSEYSDYSDQENSISGDPMFFLNKSKLLQQNIENDIKKTKVKKKLHKETFQKHFEFQKNDYKKNNPSSFDTYSNNTTKFDENSDMTFGFVSKKHFKHKNMNPHVKKGMGKGFNYDSFQQESLNDGRQRIVESFTGDIKSPTYKKKLEQPPLFNPIIGKNAVYGLPNVVKDYVDRVFVSRFKTNEIPFTQIRQTPGLGLNYNENAQFGFHDPFRVLPKTVDDLRIATKPKVSLSIPVVSGVKRNSRGIIGIVPKNRPEKFWANKQKDMVRSLSYFKAPTISGKFVVPEPNRATIKSSRVQPAKGISKDYSPIGKTKEPNRKELLKPIPANPKYNKSSIYRTNKKNYTKSNNLKALVEESKYINSPKINIKHQAYDYKNNIPDKTIKELHLNKNYLSNIKSHNSNPISVNFNDKPRNTLKEITENNKNIGNVKHVNKSMAYNLNDNIPETTLRDIHGKTKLLNNPKINIGNKIYNSNNLKPDVTLKEIHENNKNLLGTKGYSNKSYVFNKKTAITNPTLKEINQNNKYIGQTIGYSKEIAFDYKNNKPDTTLRDITGKTKYISNPKNLISNGSYQINQKNTQAPTTLKQLIENNKYINSAKYHEKGNYQINQKNTQVPTTLKELIENSKYISSPKDHERGNYQINQKNTQAPTTLKELIENNKYINSAKHYSKNRVRDDVYNAPLNDAKDEQMKIRDNGMPTLSNYNKGRFTETMYRTKEEIPMNRETYGDYHKQNPYNRLFNPDVKPKENNKVDEYRFYSHVIDNIKSNEFVNNVLFKNV